MWTLHSAISMGVAEHATLETRILKIAAVAAGCALTWNPQGGVLRGGTRGWRHYSVGGVLR